MTGRRGLLAATATLVAIAFMVAAPSASSLGIESFESEFDLEDGRPALQAGSHPYLNLTNVQTPWAIDPGFGFPLPEAQFKDIIVDLPPGVIGNPQALPKCSLVDLAFNGEGQPRCADNTAVGYIAINDGPITNAVLPVYNLDAGPGAPARFGFTIQTTTTILNFSVRGGDHGVRVTVADAPEGVPISGSRVTIWGVPGDSSHNSLRGKCLNVVTGESLGICAFQGPVKPLLRMPSSCTGPLDTKLKLDFWNHAGEFFEEDYLSQNEAAEPVGMEGCEQVPFTPSLDLQPRSHRASSPTGLHLDLHLPQEENSIGNAEADLKKVKVTLPEGMVTNASSAGGLGACTPAQIDLESTDAAQCPGDSEIGLVEVETPLLDHALPGSVFLAKQFDNPFNSLVALYIAIEDPISGVVLKLAGEVKLDPASGRVTTTFDDNPQLPFEDFRFDFFGGPRAALKTPDRCGTYAADYELTPWSGTAPVVGESVFTIDEGCDTGSFDPKLSAGATSPIAGTHSPFVTRVTREDGEQNLARIDVTLPRGELATLAGVALCSGHAAETGNCPAASQVGTLAVATGAGPQPVWIPQPDKQPTAVYLSGPYKGAPFGLVLKAPAQVGPFDLGTVITRAAIDIDPETAEVTVKSDPLPQILQGVPLEYRDVDVAVNRPHFSLNPTSCAEKQVTSRVVSSMGSVARPASRFQVGGCGDLLFKPKLGLRLIGKSGRGSHPALRAVLVMPGGGANIARAKVALPHSEFLDQAHIDTVCTRVQFAAGQCPSGAIYGHARAITPLLDEPLKGPVYLRSSSHQLPDLVADLRGQIHVIVDGRIDSVNGGIRTTFDQVPDAPVTKFVLRMKGGRKGLLVNSTNLCKQSNFVTARFTGQNGRTRDLRPLLRSDCGK